MELGKLFFFGHLIQINAPQMLQSSVMMGGVIEHKDVRNLSFVYMAIGLIASLVSVPVWGAMGLM